MQPIALLRRCIYSPLYRLERAAVVVGAVKINKLNSAQGHLDRDVVGRDGPGAPGSARERRLNAELRTARASILAIKRVVAFFPTSILHFSATVVCIVFV